jgi:hypothetical protein
MPGRLAIGLLYQKIWPEQLQTKRLGSVSFPEHKSLRTQAPNSILIRLKAGKVSRAAIVVSSYNSILVWHRVLESK